jgi:hypothetical protein
VNNAFILIACPIVPGEVTSHIQIRITDRGPDARNIQVTAIAQARNDLLDCRAREDVMIRNRNGQLRTGMPLLLKLLGDFQLVRQELLEACPFADYFSAVFDAQNSLV